MSKKRIVTTLLIAAAFFAVTGCTTTPNTNGADASPEVMTDAMMSDMTTERTIIRALFEEPSLSGENILVSCVNGEVTLFGNVESATMKQLAERTVRNLSGVTTLRNSISVN